MDFSPPFTDYNIPFMDFSPPFTDYNIPFMDFNPPFTDYNIPFMDFSPPLMVFTNPRNIFKKTKTELNYINFIAQHSNLKLLYLYVKFLQKIISSQLQQLLIETP